MTAPTSAATVPRIAVRPLAAVTIGYGVVLTSLSGRYGYHRDELYFLAAARHLAWGYVDQPPLTPFLARISTAVFGDTPAGLRVVSTLVGMATVVVVALIARELGGGRGPQLLAAICATASGYVLAVDHMVSTATTDLLVWVLVCWLALRLLRTGDGRYWVPAGLVVGVGLLNKYLALLLVGALFVALLLSPSRRLLRSGWLAAGIAVAAVVVVPNVWWQAAHDWPQLTVARGISSDDGTENRVLFVPMQLLQLSPFLVSFWVAGLVRLWRRPELRWARPVGVAYPVLAVAVVATGGKPYYALGLLLAITAAGCEPVLRRARDGRGVVRRRPVAVTLALAAATSAVITLPVLPADALGPVLPINKEQGEQVGWRELTAAVAAAWDDIAPDERGRAVIFAGNYGEAGAIERYGAGWALPAPYSGHMSYADWRVPPDAMNGPVLLVHQSGAGRLDRWFTDCREVGRVDNGHGIDNEEQRSPILLCSGTTKPWSALWPDLRIFY